MSATFPWLVTWVSLPPCICASLLLTRVHRSRKTSTRAPWRWLRPRFRLGTLCCVTLALCAALATTRDSLHTDWLAGLSAAVFWFFAYLPLLQLAGIVANDALSPPARSRLSALNPLFLPRSCMQSAEPAKAGEFRGFNPCRRTRGRVC